jgi:serine/threonine-protein kinase
MGVMVPDSDDPALGETQAAASDATLATRTPSGSSASRSGRLSLPNYQLGNLLGRGGMGDIVLGHDQLIGRDVAIKQMRSEKPSADQISRFLREAKIQARLEHPSIVPVHALGTDEAGLPYFTMKRLTGTTLAELLAQPDPPSRPRLLRILVDVCSAVELAHARGVVHRDLKPSNIMVGDFGEVYVLDWGLARIVEEGSDGAAIGEDVSSLDGETQAGALLGTPGYMAPEQIEMAHAAGPAADVYSLGAILFEVLAGEPLHPRGQGALTSTLREVTGGPAARRPDRAVPPELDELCTSALKTSPKWRPSVKELAADLQAYLDGDRDLERRKQVAADLVVKARAALDSGDVTRRAEAMQAAGRALSIDPESTAAAAIVQTIMFSPSKQYPKELEDELTASEVAVQKRQGKAAMFSFAVVLAYLAVASLNGVTAVPFVLGVAGYTVVLATIVYRVTQRRAQPWEMLVIATGNALLAALLSRTYGSLLIVPAVTCIMAMSLTSYPLLIDRKWIVIGLLGASWIVPVALELQGSLAGTFELEHQVLHLTSHVMALEGSYTLAVLIGANVMTFIVVGLFASALATSRRNALRQTEITAWHLRQLLPR